MEIQKRFFGCLQMTEKIPEHLYWILLYEFDIASNRHISYRLLTGHIVAIAQPINNYLTQRQ